MFEHVDYVRRIWPLYLENVGSQDDRSLDEEIGRLCLRLSFAFVLPWFGTSDAVPRASC